MNRGWRRAAVLAGTLGLLAAACGHGAGGGGGASILGRQPAGGTAEVIRGAAASPYLAPANGRLTDPQVRMYIEVRERESRLREAAASAPPGAANQPPADLRAAQELQVDPGEYQWVHARVAEAEAAATTEALYQRMSAGREQLLARMRRERDALAAGPEAAASGAPLATRAAGTIGATAASGATGASGDRAAERAAAERRIEDFKRGLEASEPQIPAAVRANVALLARFREPLARLHALEESALAAAAGLETSPRTAATPTSGALPTSTSPPPPVSSPATATAANAAAATTTSH